MAFSQVLHASCFLMLVLLGGTKGGIETPPENTAGIVGDTVILTCLVDALPPAARIVWLEYITFPEGSTISDNEFLLSHPNQHRYRIVHDDPFQYSLEISNLQLSDGGRYACRDTLSAPPNVGSGELQLIVMAGETNCTGTAPSDGIVVEGQGHSIECLVTYQGTLPPHMYWTGPPEFIVGGSTVPPTVWSGVGYTVDRSMAGKRFECLTNFTSPGPQPEGIADNAPHFENFYRAPTITVYWGPSGTYADPLKSVYQVGDQLTCHTDALPEPSYRWQNMRNLQEFPGQVFTFTPDLAGTNQSMRCQVQNVILGFVYSDNIFVPSLVEAPPSPTTPTTTLATTTHPPVSDCEDFTGYWVSEEPFGELLLELDTEGQIGEIYGIFRNRSDTIWVEVIGTARRSDWSYIGLSAIWPLNDGITGISAECHRCFGTEVMIGDGMLRASAESAQCGDASIPRPYDPYRFERISSKAAAIEAQGPVSVHIPTNISKRLGIQLK